MSEKEIYNILGISSEAGVSAIKEAYYKKLPSVNPEDDPEGFKQLRAAYEEAVKLLNEKRERIENEIIEKEIKEAGIKVSENEYEPEYPAIGNMSGETGSDLNMQSIKGECDSPVNMWLNDIGKIYSSLKRRLDLQEWHKIFENKIYKDLEYGNDAVRAFFTFLANHFRLTADIYRFIDSKLKISDNQEMLPSF